MKVFNITSKDLKFWKNWNLIDGQARGEIVFRKIFFLLAICMALYLFLLTVVGEKEDRVVEVQAVEEIVIEKEEWVEGDRVTEKADGTTEVVPAEVFMESSTQRIKDFTKSYSGSRIDDKYFALLSDACKDDHTLKLVIAVSVAETSMGKNTRNDSNFWGFFKNGNRNYDPSQEVMAQEICNSFGKHYNDVLTNKAKANRYVGYDSTNWMRNVSWAYNQMK